MLNGVVGKTGMYNIKYLVVASLLILVLAFSVLVIQLVVGFDKVGKYSEDVAQNLFYSDRVFLTDASIGSVRVFTIDPGIIQEDMDTLGVSVLVYKDPSGIGDQDGVYVDKIVVRIVKDEDVVDYGMRSDGVVMVGYSTKLEDDDLLMSVYVNEDILTKDQKRAQELIYWSILHAIETMDGKVKSATEMVEFQKLWEVNVANNKVPIVINLK